MLQFLLLFLFTAVVVVVMSAIVIVAAVGVVSTVHAVRADPGLVSKKLGL